LINDPKLHDDLVATLSDIRSGAAEAKTFVANAQSIIDQVKQGKGAIGTLVFDQKVGDDIKSTVATLREVSDKISKGQGTLGKLLNDDSMLRDAQAIMKKADRALDGREDAKEREGSQSTSPTSRTLAALCVFALRPTS